MVTPKQNPQPNSPEKVNLVNVRAADEHYIEEVAESYRLRDLQPKPPLTAELRRVFDYLRQQADGQLADHAQPAPSQISTKELADKFLAAKRGSISEASLASYGYTLFPFAKHCPILPLKPEPIEAYLARYESKQTAHDIHAKLGLFYRFLHERYGFPNVIELIARPRVKRQRKSGLTLEAAKALLEACRTDRELGLVHLYLGHGLRRDEALRLNIGHISDGQMFVTGKTANEPMPLLPETGEVLLRLAGERKPGEPIFLSQWGKRLSHQMVNAAVKTIMTRAGINRPGVNCHTLRHTFATLMTEYGLDEISCRRLMRHADSSMTERYVHLDLTTLSRKLGQYSPLRLANPPSVNWSKTSISSNSLQHDPAQLLPQLLDQLEALGETAKQLKQALGSNGHQAAAVAEVKEYLERQASK
ncbi:Tyrosine recombinase XerC [subsurface metagenome]